MVYLILGPPDSYPVVHAPRALTNLPTLGRQSPTATIESLAGTRAARCVFHRANGAERLRSSELHGASSIERAARRVFERANGAARRHSNGRRGASRRFLGPC